MQENTSSTHSIGHGGDISDEGANKVTLESHGNLAGARGNANGMIGLSPVIGPKTNKPHQMSNLLKS